VSARLRKKRRRKRKSQKSVTRAPRKRLRPRTKTKKRKRRMMKKRRKLHRRKGLKGKVKEGSRVKFEDDEGNVVKGTVTSLDDGQATVEDKSGDEYEIDAKHLTVL